MDQDWEEITPSKPDPKDDGGKRVRYKNKAKAPAPAADDDWEEVPADQRVAVPKTATLTDEDSPYLDGLLQGSTLGYWDEMAAALEAVIADTKYKDNWDRRQADLARLREAAPGKMLAGELSGAVGLGMIPGAGWLNAGKGASLAARLGSAMAQGALYRMGTSPYSIFEDYEDPHAAAKLMTLEAGKGMGEGLVGMGVSKGVEQVGKLGYKVVAPPIRAGLKWGMTKLSKPLFGVPVQTAREILETPKLYQGPVQSMDEVAEEHLLPLINSVSKQATDHKAKAVSALTDMPASTADEIGDAILQKFQENGLLWMDKDSGKLVGKYPGVMAELQRVYSYAKNLQGKKGFLTEKQVHRLDDHLDPMARWNISSTSPQKEVAETFRRLQGAVSDKVKMRNPAYKESMEASAEMTGDLERMRAALGLVKNGKKPDDTLSEEEIQKLLGRYAFNDTTLGKMRAIRKREVMANMLQDFADRYGNTEETKHIPAMIKRVSNEEKLNVRAPSIGSLVGSMWAAQGGPIAKTIAGISAARDMGGGVAFKKLAPLTIPGEAPKLDPFLRPAMTDLMASPILNPYYTGYPLQGISPEEYREGKANGKWE